MSSIDWIKGGRAKGIKRKRSDRPWQVTGSLLFLDGQQVGEVDWTRSRYLKTGGHLDFYAMVSGTMHVLPETSRVGYVEPPRLKWGIPVPVSEGDGDDD